MADEEDEPPDYLLLEFSRDFLIGLDRHPQRPTPLPIDLSRRSRASMDFSRGGGKPGEKVDEGQLMQEVQHNLRAQLIQEFYQTVRDKCFKMCITAPSSSLSSSEQKCLSRCMDRYQEATNIITRTIINQQ